MHLTYLFKGKQRIDGYFMRGNQKNIKNTSDNDSTCSTQNLHSQ